MSATPGDQWDQHILIVFSVLAGLSFDKAFDVVASSGFRLAYIILSIMVFYIVLDNWYYLHKDLRIIDVDKPVEIAFYLLSTIVYSCLPYLYIVKNVNPSISLEPPEWMLVNLVLICFIDALRKMVTLIKMRSNSRKYVNDTDRRLVGAYVFYALSGFFYTILLTALIFASVFSSLSVVIKTLIVVLIWGFVRAIDLTVVPKAADLIAQIFLEEHKPINPITGEK